MRGARLATLIAGAAIAVGLAAPAHADTDTEFAERLHTHGIYGQKDFNAWLGKISCKRLHRGVDADAFDSAWFVQRNLQRGSTTEQAWQFLGEAIPTYCPDQIPVLESAAAQPGR